MVIVYSNHCPKCIIIEKKLLEANIPYKICDDQETLESKGFDLMPVIETDGQLMGFGEAVRWINERS